MKVAGLFAGIGGIEYGLSQSGFTTELFCEIMPEAQQILKKNFSQVPIHTDIKTLKSLPTVDLVSAGFPCQDLSIAGTKSGMSGLNSSLIAEVFRLIEKAKKNKPNFLLIENVPYLLSLNKGEAIRYITKTVEALGYKWAYRIIDPRGFGLPQRRPRIIFLASKVIHPKFLLFSQSEISQSGLDDKLIIDSENNYGFYWTEGRIGIGWAKDSIPPIKGGSGLGIPSAPAIWMKKNNFFGTPVIEDAERLQGFPEHWTDDGVGIKKGRRWKLIGNAVNTTVSEWIGQKIKNEVIDGPNPELIYKLEKSAWPKAAFSEDNKIFGVKTSLSPETKQLIPIDKFLKHPLSPLSERAAMGFLKRVKESTIVNYPNEFIFSLEDFIQDKWA